MASGTNRIRFGFKNQKYETLHIETPLSIVNIRCYLNHDGKAVEHIEVLGNEYAYQGTPAARLDVGEVSVSRETGVPRAVGMRVIEEKGDHVQL